MPPQEKHLLSTMSHVAYGQGHVNNVMELKSGLTVNS